MSLEDAKKFMNEHETCVLATTHADGSPQAATVGFSVQGNKVLISTNSKTRKYKNLTNNSKVAVVVGTEGAKTLQLEGEAKEIPAANNQKLIDEHFLQVPAAKEYADEEGQTYFLITPAWLRFTDYTAQNPIFETRDFS